MYAVCYHAIPLEVFHAMSASFQLAVSAWALKLPPAYVPGSVRWITSCYSFVYPKVKWFLAWTGWELSVCILIEDFTLDFLLFWLFWLIDTLSTLDFGRLMLFFGSVSTFLQSRTTQNAKKITNALAVVAHVYSKGSGAVATVGTFFRIWG